VRAQRLGAFALLGIDEAAYEAGLAALTPAALRTTLSHYLQPHNLTLAIAAPKPLVDEARLRSLIAETAARSDEGNRSKSRTRSGQRDRAAAVLQAAQRRASRHPAR